MNKPVAYIHKTILGWTSTFIHPETEPNEWIPLYTHPVKELTDEEIMELQAEYGIDSDLTCHSVKDFVSAILRKAQEK